MAFLSNLFGTKDEASAPKQQSKPPIKQDCNNFGSANAESTPMAVPQPNTQPGQAGISESVSESVTGSVYGSVAQSLPTQFGSAMSPTMSPKASALAAALAKQEEEHKQKLRQFRRNSQAAGANTSPVGATPASANQHSPSFSKVGSPGSPITADEAMNLSRAGGFQGRMRAGSNAAGGSGIAAQLANAGPAQDITFATDGGSVKRKNSNKYQGFGLVAAYSNSGMN